MRVSIRPFPSNFVHLCPFWSNCCTLPHHCVAQRSSFRLVLRSDDRFLYVRFLVNASADASCSRIAASQVEKRRFEQFRRATHVHSKARTSEYFDPLM
jgi:hypothetical protein